MHAELDKVIYIHSIDMDGWTEKNYAFQDEPSQEPVFACFVKSFPEV